MNTISKFNKKLNRKLIEIVDHADPNVPLIGIFAVTGYFMFYIVWKYLIPQPYENLGLRTAEALIAVPLILYHFLTSSLRKFFPVYFLISALLMIPFFFFFMMMKNEWSQVWMMSALAGTMLMIFFISDWLIIALLTLFGYALAHLTVKVLDGEVLYTHMDISYLPIYLFTFIGSFVLNHQKRVSYDAQLSLIRSLGGTIAHEMRNPLSSVTCSIETIKDMLPKRPTSGAESESTCNITCKSLNNIHEVIDLGSKSIRRGNKIIDSILSSLDGGEIDRAHFRYHSSEKSILAAIERD